MADNSINDLARLFKERENVAPIGTMVGTVVSTSPISIRIGKIIVSGERLLVASRLLDRVEELEQRNIQGGIVGEYTKYELKYSKVLNVGDRVIVCPTSDKQTFIVVDKLIGGGM